MIERYRAWLASELALLGNASHHAYAFGQANMAQRALERLDAETAGIVTVDRALAERSASALDALKTKGDLDPALEELLAALRAMPNPLPEG